MNLTDLDKEFDATTLELIRSHIHKNIVKKLSTVLTRSDYVLYFAPDYTQGDLAYYAGKPMAIVIKASPFDGERVKILLHRAFSNRLVIRSLLRTMQVVKRSDAHLIYGVEYERLVDEYIQEYRKLPHVNQFECNLIANFIKIEVVDKTTGRSIRLEAENTDVFTLQERAIKLLRSE